MNNDSCKGCRVKLDECFIQVNNMADNCPCSTCLVKGICLDICQERNDYAYKNYFKDHPERMRLKIATEIQELIKNV